MIRFWLLSLVAALAPTGGKLPYALAHRNRQASRLQLVPPYCVRDPKSTNSETRALADAATVDPAAARASDFNALAAVVLFELAEIED